MGNTTFKENSKEIYSLKIIIYFKEIKLMKMIIIFVDDLWNISIESVVISVEIQTRLVVK